MIFTKGKGKLNKATIEWEKEEILEYVTKETILRSISDIKRVVKTTNSIEELRELVNNVKYEVSNKKSKVNDNIYKINKCKTNKYSYIFNAKKLTTLWGCRPHNHQGYNKEEFNIKHPTVKPIQIMERLIEMTTTENMLVLDPFMGSGTTGIACNSLNREFIGFELLEEYYTIAKNRLPKVAQNSH